MSGSGRRVRDVTPEQRHGPAYGSHDERALPAERRCAEREGAGHNVTVELAGVRYVVEVEDISRIGARILVRKGLMPSVGQCVTLQFMNSVSVEARVIHILGRSAGLSFLQPFPDDMDPQHFDEMGSDYFRSVLKLQIAGAAG